MDRAPEERERNMARWTIAGSVGYVVGPALIAVAVVVGLGWRGVLLLLALASVPFAWAGRRSPTPQAKDEDADADAKRGLLAAFRNRQVLRWLFVLEAADLLGDVLHGFVALYFVDVAHVGAVEAAFAVAVWTGAALVGDVLLLVVLRHMSGWTYLRISAAIVLAAYPVFLVVPSPAAKLAVLGLLGLLNAGWYALPKAALYGELPGRSGTAIAVAGIGGFAAAGVPAGLGIAAQQFGLQATMWLLLAAPVALLVAARSPNRGRGA